MKYGNFKIFKFSTISKRINHIRDSFSIIHKNIKNILGFVANFFSNIIKYIFSEINESIKLVLRGSFSIIRKNIIIISKHVADFFSYIIKYIFSKINQSIKFII